MGRLGILLVSTFVCPPVRLTASCTIFRGSGNRQNIPHRNTNIKHLGRHSMAQHMRLHIMQAGGLPMHEVGVMMCSLIWQHECEGGISRRPGGRTDCLPPSHACLYLGLFGGHRRSRARCFLLWSSILGPLVAHLAWRCYYGFGSALA